MEENNEFLKLSVEDRCQHKLWNARLSGYEDAEKLFLQQDDEKSPEFAKYAGLIKKFVIDSNAVAQEKGLSAVLVFVQKAAIAPKTVNDVMNGLISKCFSSPRVKTRNLAIEIALMYIEIEKHEVVVEELIKGLENKSPKVVSVCIIALQQSLNAFGSQVISIKSLAKVLPKLLEDRDKTVREESKSLCVEIYRWVGEAIKPQLGNLKSVTLNDLEKEFLKTVDKKVAATRYFRSQQEKIAKAKEEAIASGHGEEGHDTNVGPTKVDPYELMTAVDILAKLPKDFYEQCEAQKWQERKKVLETLLELTTNTKLESGDYGDLVRVLKKLISKDSNVLIVALATKCLANLVLGLRKKFQPYVSACIPSLFEKFKEKKQNVVIALREAVDALYSISSFETMQEDIQSALSNKNPQIRAETCAFLTRCFCSCSSSQLSKKLLKEFTVSLLKTLNDTDATVRENAAEALGTALKLVGEHAMSPYFKDVDAIKMAKIKVFCDKATISSKPQAQQSTEKQTSTEPPKPAAVAKAVMGGARKTASAGSVKPKTVSSQPKAVKSAGANQKRSNTEPAEPEFKEQELSDEDVAEKASEIFSDDVISGLSSSNWNDRLAAVEKFFEIIKQMEKGSLPAQVLIKLLAKKPGFKENNIQILKLRFEVLAYIFDNSRISQNSVECCLADVVDKIGDVKNGAFAGAALSSLAEATSLEYISKEVLNIAFKQRNPKNQSEALLWVSNAIKQFGLKVNLRDIIDYAKKGFSSVNPSVRNSTLTLVGVMYMYVGKNLRSFFEEEKPTLLAQLDTEFEKMKDIKPPLPERGKGSKHKSEDLDEKASKEENVAQVNLSDLLPRIDISGQITHQVLSDLSDKDWHLRSDALQKISSIITDAKFITPNLGDLSSALKPRLADTNKNLAVQALRICQMLGTSLSSQCPKQLRNFAPGILTCLGDNKANVRASALVCLNAWMDNCPLNSLFEGEMLFDALKSDNPFLRIELFSWLTEKLPTVTSLSANELNTCIPILLGCLEDRNPDVRKKASECLFPFMIHVGYDSMAKHASKLKPASKNTVLPLLDKVRQNLPEKSSNKPKQAKSSIPAPSDRSSPLQAPGSDEGIKTRLIRSTSKPKLASKSTASVKGKKEEEVDTSPSLVLNNMKEQRMLEEKALRVLKWNFTTPREEFYVQLKEQAIAANWSKTLISHCFHNDFKFHIKAIDLLMESHKNDIEASAANLDLILKWMALRFFDTNPSVLIKSLEYLQALFQSLVKIGYRLLESEAASFIPYLILKIGDTKDPVRKGVREILKIISKIYPSSKLFSYIMQGLTSKNARQRAECLEELGSMIEVCGLNVCQPSPAVALKEIAKQISDRDNSVRNASLNCFVQAYFIEGEKVYKYVGQLSDKDMCLLEERIKRSMKTKPVKPPPESSSTSVTATPIASANLNTTISLETPKVARTSRIQPSGPLRLDMDDIEQMFRHKQSDFEVPGYVQVNADDILNLPDIQLPQTRLRPPATSLKMLNSSTEASTAVNLVMAQLAAQEIPVVVEAFVQVDEVLKQSDQAVAVLGPRVDQLLVMGAMQYRYAHTKHMADENICKADVIKLYRCVTAALITLFDNPILAKKASRDVLRDLIPHLITVILDNRLDDLQEGAQVVKVINVLIMRVLQKSNPTHVFSALIKLLHDCVGSVNVSDRFTDLVMKCLWKNIRLIRQVINELNIDRILLDIHVFLKTFPSSSWKERNNDTPIRTVKTILYHLVEIKDEDIMKHLSLISDRQESDMVTYLHKLLSKKKGDKQKAVNKNAAAEDNRQKRNRASPLKLSKSTHEALTEIFKKIGSKDQTKEGLSELYEFTQKHPEADIEPYLKNSSEFFRDYIRKGIKDLERKKSIEAYQQESPIVKSRGSDENAGWNSNLSDNDGTFKTRTGSQYWQDRFPPLPPPTIDTTPMDYVEWLKSTAARLGRDPSKYDDPAILERWMGNGNEETVTDETISQMFADLDRYKKIIEDLKNAA